MNKKNKQEQQAALIKNIRENERIIFKICNSYCRNKSDREDLAQEIIYQLLKSYHSFSDEYRFSTWMYRVALNVAIPFHRKNKSKKVFYLEDINSDHHDESASSELEDNLTILEKYLDELKELDKALMILYLESKSYKEISEILGISETNVATKISRVKEVLKQKFSKNIN
jgi:RNA polymerase sigma-70 factor (ECF subfamily)